VFILKVLKVLCFDTLLQVFILKVDSGMAGALAQFCAAAILLQTIFLGNVGGKGVSGAGEYFMGYYTIWLAPVKDFLVPFWESGKGIAGRLWRLAEIQRPQSNKPSLRHPSGVEP
jgi:hypothetical protein